MIDADVDSSSLLLIVVYFLEMVDADVDYP